MNPFLVSPQKSHQRFSRSGDRVEKVFFRENEEIPANEHAEISYRLADDAYNKTTLCLLTQNKGYFKLSHNLPDDELLEFTTSGTIPVRIYISDVADRQQRQRQTSTSAPDFRKRERESSDGESRVSMDQRKRYKTEDGSEQSPKYTPLVESPKEKELGRVRDTLAVELLSSEEGILSSLYNLNVGSAPNDASKKTATVVILDIVIGRQMTVTLKSKPRIRVWGTLLDGTFFGGYKQTTAIDMTDKDTPIGLRRGLMGMKVGGRRIIVVPPELGYGPASVEKIPANSTLVYDCTLVEIE